MRYFITLSYDGNAVGADRICPQDGSPRKFKIELYYFAACCMMSLYYWQNMMSRGFLRCLTKKIIIFYDAEICGPERH